VLHELPPLAGVVHDLLDLHRAAAVFSRRPALEGLGGWFGVLGGEEEWLPIPVQLGFCWGLGFGFNSWVVCQAGGLLQNETSGKTLLYDFYPMMKQWTVM
jgi:hypothetical protein